MPSARVAADKRRTGPRRTTTLPTHFNRSWSARATLMIFTLVLATALSSAQEHSFISAATERVRKALGTHWTQSCDSWHPGTHTALQAELESQVAGQQHIIEDIVDSVQAHLHETSQSPLVMSFHGASGTGKTFVSEKLCLAMHGLDRKAVAELENNGQRESVAKKMGCLFYRAHDLQEEEIDSIKVIKQRIHKIMKEAVVVFDEVDKIKAGAIDAITPYLTGHVKGISYAQLVIIFTSNVGERALLDTLVKNKSRRLSIKLQDQLSEKLEDATQTVKSPKKQGFVGANFINKGLVDRWFGFLPHDVESIEQCARVDAENWAEGLVLEGQVKKMIIKPSVNKYIAKRVLRGKTIAKQGCRLVEAERRKFSSKFPRYNTVVECPKNNGWLDTGPETCWKHSNSVCTWYVHSDEAGVQHECKSVREKDL